MIYSNLGLNITIVEQINYLPVLFQRPACQGRGSREDSLAGKPNTLGSLDASSDPSVVFLFFTLFNMFKNISGYLVLDKSK